MPKYEQDTSNLVNDTTKKYQYNHGEQVDQGNSFPITPEQGQFFIRTDYMPNAMFVFRGTRWQRVSEYNDNTTMRDRVFNAGPFINNNATTVIGNKEMPERQALSQVIKPKTDA